MAHAAVNIPEKLYFKIGEVCDLVGVQAHVLRYWETEFPQLAPQKNRSGQRSYRRKDVEISLRIKELLYDDMYTIAGARKKLQAELREPPRLKIVPREHQEEEVPGIQEEPEEATLFEGHEDFDLEDIEVQEVRQSNPAITEPQREALKSIAEQLLELRELLISKPRE